MHDHLKCSTINSFAVQFDCRSRWVRIGIFSVALWQIMFCHALDIASAPGRQT